MRLHMRLVVAVALGLLAIVFAGCGGDKPSTGSVSGKITDSATGAPGAGVTLQLVNNAFKPYTSSASAAKFGGYSQMTVANRAAIVATTLSGSDGKYSMTSVPNGNYLLVPISSDNSLSISPAIYSGDPIVHAIVDGNSSVFDFMSEPLNGSPFRIENFTPPDVTFEVKVTFTNLPKTVSQNDINITPYRRLWLAFIPFFKRMESVNIVQNSTDKSAIFTFRYGGFALVATSENTFYFNVICNDGTQFVRFTIPLIGFNIGYTPAASSWVYDYSNKIMTRTQ